MLLCELCERGEIPLTEGTEIHGEESQKIQFLASLARGISGSMSVTTIRPLVVIFERSVHNPLTLLAIQQIYWRSKTSLTESQRYRGILRVLCASVREFFGCFLEFRFIRLRLRRARISMREIFMDSGMFAVRAGAE